MTRRRYKRAAICSIKVEDVETSYTQSREIHKIFMEETHQVGYVTYYVKFREKTFRVSPKEVLKALKLNYTVTKREEY